MRVRSQALACFLLAALAVPTLAAPDTGAEMSREARQAERQARKAERQKMRALKEARKAEQREAKAFTKQYQLAAPQLKANVSKLQTELTWHLELDAAKRAAAEENKPILLIQALGDLSGLL